MAIIHLASTLLSKSSDLPGTSRPFELRTGRTMV